MSVNCSKRPDNGRGGEEEARTTKVKENGRLGSSTSVRHPLHSEKRRALARLEGARVCRAALRLCTVAIF